MMSRLVLFLTLIYFHKTVNQVLNITTVNNTIAALPHNFTKVSSPHNITIVNHTTANGTHIKVHGAETDGNSTDQRKKGLRWGSCEDEKDQFNTGKNKNESDGAGDFSGDGSVTCKVQANGHLCGPGLLTSKFYYDVVLEDCKEGSFGSCKYSDLNAFEKLDECHQTCRDTGDGAKIITMNLTGMEICRLQPQFGDCDSYHSLFYFDITHRDCRGFSWSGCGGNFNRFETHQQCFSFCTAFAIY